MKNQQENVSENVLRNPKSTCSSFSSVVCFWVSEKFFFEEFSCSPYAMSEKWWWWFFTEVSKSKATLSLSSDIHTHVTLQNKIKITLNLSLSNKSTFVAIHHVDDRKFPSTFAMESQEWFFFSPSQQRSKRRLNIVKVKWTKSHQLCMKSFVTQMNIYNVIEWSFRASSYQFFRLFFSL